MLTEMDKRLIQKEQEDEHFKCFEPLLPLLHPSCPVKTIEELFANYHIHETTQHWYDSDPNECHNCKRRECRNCTIWKKWEYSEKRLSFNNWIDVYGPGIWDMSQEESDKQAEGILTEAIKNINNAERLFFTQPKDDKNYFYIFYYNRDRKFCDWWFIFKK